MIRDAQGGKASRHACAALSATTFHDMRLRVSRQSITRCVPTSIVVLYVRCARTLQPICRRRIPIWRSLGRQLIYRFAVEPTVFSLFT